MQVYLAPIRHDLVVTLRAIYVLYSPLIQIMETPLLLHTSNYRVAFTSQNTEYNIYVLYLPLLQMMETPLQLYTSNYTVALTSENTDYKKVNRM